MTKLLRLCCSRFFLLAHFPLALCTGVSVLQRSCCLLECDLRPLKVRLQFRRLGVCGVECGLCLLQLALSYESRASHHLIAYRLSRIRNQVTPARVQSAGLLPLLKPVDQEVGQLFLVGHMQ